MGKEARVKEARAKVMEKLEGGKAREEVCSSAAEMGRGGVAYKRECARLCGWMICYVLLWGKCCMHVSW